jgi:hypothetical protein
LPGEPVFDPATKRFGVGIGSNQAVWFPKATTDGNLQFDEGQGLVSTDGAYSLKFTATGLSWKVNNIEVFSVRDTGVVLRGGLMMRSAAGADTVIVGYAHWVAIMAMLWNIKALLRKIVAGTATTADINALFNAPNSLNLTTLDPAFPEAPTL